MIRVLTWALLCIACSVVAVVWWPAGVLPCVVVLVLAWRLLAAHAVHGRDGHGHA